MHGRFLEITAALHNQADHDSFQWGRTRYFVNEECILHASHYHAAGELSEPGQPGQITINDVFGFGWWMTWSLAVEAELDALQADPLDEGAANRTVATDDDDAFRHRLAPPGECGLVFSQFHQSVLVALLDFGRSSGDHCFDGLIRIRQRIQAGIVPILGPFTGHVDEHDAWITRAPR